MSGWKTMLLGGAGGLLFGGSTVGVVFRGGSQQVSAEVSKELKDRESEISRLGAELEEKVASLTSEKNKHETDLKEKEKELQQLEEKQQELQKLTEGLDNKKREVEETKASLKQLKQTQSDYEKMKRQLETKLKGQESEISKIEKSKNSLEQSKVKLQEAKKQVQNQIQQLNQQIKQVKDFDKLNQIFKELAGGGVPETQIQEIKKREGELLSLRANKTKELKDSVTRMLERLISGLKGVNQNNSDFQSRLEKIFSDWKEKVAKK